MSDTKTSDTKFLGLCILLASFIISGTIVWSTKANQCAMTAPTPAIGLTASTPAATNATTVTISGPVTLAPFSAPIPVTISTSNDTPIIVKDLSEKQWTR